MGKIQQQIIQNGASKLILISNKDLLHFWSFFIKMARRFNGTKPEKNVVDPKRIYAIHKY